MTSLQRIGAATVLLFGIALFPSKVLPGELNLLTWEGYSEPEITGAWEERTGCKISRTYVGSNDEFPAKLAAGGSVYDMVSPSIDTTTILAKMGVVEPVDISLFGEHWEGVYESFRQHPGIVGPTEELRMEGKVWAVPYAWGSIAWMYRNDKFEEPPTSVTTIWDPEYTGKVSIWDDKTEIYITARLLFGQEVNVYDLSDEQLEAVKNKLIEQKPITRKYWSTAGELVNLFANGEVWISNTWGGYQSALLAEQNIPVTEFIPVEMADGWQDAWMVVKGTPNMDCALQFAAFVLTPEAQCAMAKFVGWAAANHAAAKECLTQEEYDTRHQGELDYISNLDFWQEPARVDKYIETWNAVKAAQ